MLATRTTLPKYPTERLIVFAGALGSYTLALARQRVDALMASYIDVASEGKSVEKFFSIVDGWPQYRYLDSGVFTFIRQSETSRITKASQPTAVQTYYDLTKAVLDATTDRPRTSKQIAEQLKKPASSISSHLRKLYETGRLSQTSDGSYFRNPHYSGYDIRLNVFLAYLNRYADYLRRNLHSWDFVVETDVDTLSFGRDDGSIVSGVDATRISREHLKKIAGDRLLPVWHASIDHPPYPKFRDLVREFPYIALGSDIELRQSEVRYLCDYAHANNVIVHGLGTSREDVLDVTPLDTVDSTTWITAVKYGRVGGMRLTWRDVVDHSEVAKSRRLKLLVEELGFTEEQIFDSKNHLARAEVAVAYLLKRQRNSRPIPPPLSRSYLFEPVEEVSSASTGPTTPDQGLGPRS